MRKSLLVASAAVFLGASVPVLVPAPAYGAVCGAVGGVHVDITGCADPLSELNEALAPPPPPGAPPPPPPPPVFVPAPNVSVCADVGRRVSVSGCI